MSKALTEHQLGLVNRLVAAQNAYMSLFYAKNSFNLCFGHGSRMVGAEKMLEDFEKTGLLNKKQMKSMTKLVEAQAGAFATLNELREKTDTELREATDLVLREFATELGKGWFEFKSKSIPGTARAKVQGFDSFYQAKNTKSFCGSVRVSPHGDGSSEPWSFCIENGRITVQKYCDY